MSVLVAVAPEDVALFDPEDDRADYTLMCETVDTVDVTRFYAAFWPESVAV